MNKHQEDMYTKRMTMKNRTPGHFSLSGSVVAPPPEAYPAMLSVPSVVLLPEDGLGYTFLWGYAELTGELGGSGLADKHWGSPPVPRRDAEGAVGTVLPIVEVPRSSMNASRSGPRAPLPFPC